MRSLTPRARIGYWLAVVLALVDVAAVLTPAPPEGADGPPLAVLLFATVMGVVTLVAAALAWRTGRRSTLRIMAASRILSAITALPAFFVDGVPAVFVAWGAATVVLTVVAVVLLMHRVRAGAGARTAATSGGG